MPSPSLLYLRQTGVAKASQKPWGDLLESTSSLDEERVLDLYENNQVQRAPRSPLFNPDYNILLYWNFRRILDQAVPQKGLPTSAWEPPVMERSQLLQAG